MFNKLHFFFLWVKMYALGHSVRAAFCALLQLSLIGWIPAAMWSVYQLSQFNTDRKIAAANHARGEV